MENYSPVDDAWFGVYENGAYQGVKAKVFELPSYIERWARKMNARVLLSLNERPNYVSSHGKYRYIHGYIGEGWLGEFLRARGIRFDFFYRTDGKSCHVDFILYRRGEAFKIDAKNSTFGQPQSGYFALQMPKAGFNKNDVQCFIILKYGDGEMFVLGRVSDWQVAEAYEKAAKENLMGVMYGKKEEPILRIPFCEFAEAGEEFWQTFDKGAGTIYEIVSDQLQAPLDWDEYWRQEREGQRAVAAL